MGPAGCRARTIVAIDGRPEASPWRPQTDELAGVEPASDRRVTPGRGHEAAAKGPQPQAHGVEAAVRTAERRQAREGHDQEQDGTGHRRLVELGRVSGDLRAGAAPRPGRRLGRRPVRDARPRPGRSRRGPARPCPAPGRGAAARSRRGASGPPARRAGRRRRGPSACRRRPRARAPCSPVPGRGARATRCRSSRGGAGRSRAARG